MLHQQIIIGGGSGPLVIVGSFRDKMGLKWNGSINLFASHYFLRAYIFIPKYIVF